MNTKLQAGWHTERIFPVYRDGSTAHITDTRIDENGEVIMAVSNSCGGITYAKGSTRSYHNSNERWCPWDEVSHFEDADGSRYEKSPNSRSLL